MIRPIVTFMHANPSGIGPTSCRSRSALSSANGIPGQCARKATNGANMTIPKNRSRAVRTEFHTNRFAAWYRPSPDCQRTIVAAVHTSIALVRPILNYDLPVDRFLSTKFQASPNQPRIPFRKTTASILLKKTCGDSHPKGWSRPGRTRFRFPTSA